jgi:hypothetical protein
MPAGSDRNKRLQLYGWMLFLVCSFFFIADNAIAGDLLGVAGSVVFLLGCVVFLIPLIQKQA